MSIRSVTGAARWALLGVLAAVVAADAAPVDLSKAYRQRRALVIGVNEYTRWTPLRCARGDAELVGKKLESLGFRVDYLLDGEATRERVIERLGALQNQVEEGDQVFVYFSGHGDTREAGAGAQKRRLGYLVPVDGDPRNPFSAISMETLRELSGLLRARHVMFALDACFSGALLTEKGPGGVRAKTPAFYQEALAKPVRFVLTAGTAGQKAVEVDGRGLFTRQLLQALDGAADPASRDGVLTGLDIASYVRKTVSEIARQRYGRAQTPVFGYMEGQGDGEFLLLTRAVPPPAEPPRPTIREEPRQELGSLAISAKLPGIEVWLGDQKIGETRAGRALVVDNLPVGTYRVKAEKQGKRWEREIQVAANQRAEVVIDIEPLGPPKTVRSEDGAEMIFVPGPTAFLRGSSRSHNESPQHLVIVSPYYIDKFEVTNALYGRFIAATGRGEPRFWKDSTLNSSSQPVVGVTWFDADAYCRWANKRLPTEAEWELAASGGDGRVYPWGNEWEPSRLNGKARGPGRPTPVGSYPKDISPYGAYDMAGNVAEWVADWFEWYRWYMDRPERTQDPRGPDSGQLKVVRGGAWNREEPDNFSTTTRPVFRPGPGAQLHSVGFRCARGVSP